MPDQSDNTWESAILEGRPQVREAVLESEDFRVWKDQLPSVVVDGARYYIRGGDMLKDEDQLIFEWALRKGLLPNGFNSSEGSG
jgi:hypothetical protein